MHTRPVAATLLCIFIIIDSVEEGGDRDRGWQDKISHPIEPGAWRHGDGGRQLESLGLPPDVEQLYVVQGGSLYTYREGSTSSAITALPRFRQWPVLCIQHGS